METVMDQGLEHVVELVTETSTNISMVKKMALQDLETVTKHKSTSTDRTTVTPEMETVTVKTAKIQPYKL